MHRLPIGAHLGIGSTSCVLGRIEVTLPWSHSLGFYRSGCRGLQVLGLGWWHKALPHLVQATLSASSSVVLANK
eukprot:scaffold55923_cov25-Cyclotella_meneghiniana.AAC.2